MYTAVDHQFMSQALAEAQNALYLSNPNPRVGCIIVKGGVVIGRGHTQRVGGSHAEVQALADVKANGLDAAGSTIYVTLEPCTMCAGAMLHARVDRIVFGTPDPKTGAAGSVLDVFAMKQINHQTTIEGGMMSEECGQLLRNFFKERR